MLLYYITTKNERRTIVYIAENIPLYPNTDVIQIVKDDDGLTFNHEMFHIFPQAFSTSRNISI